MLALSAGGRQLGDLLATLRRSLHVQREPKSCFGANNACLAGGESGEMAPPQAALDLDEVAVLEDAD